MHVRSATISMLRSNYLQRWYASVTQRLLIKPSFTIALDKGPFVITHLKCITSHVARRIITLQTLSVLISVLYDTYLQNCPQAACWCFNQTYAASSAGSTFCTCSICQHCCFTPILLICLWTWIMRWMFHSDQIKSTMCKQRIHTLIRDFSLLCCIPLTHLFPLLTSQRNPQKYFPYIAANSVVTDKQLASHADHFTYSGGILLQWCQWGWVPPQEGSY